MKIDGISLIEGANVSNFSIATGTSYPSNPNAGELFFRTDSPNTGLYVHDGSAWGFVSTSSSTAWAGITGTPTTLSGYGITDAVNLSGTQTITGSKTFDAQIVSTITGVPPFSVASTVTVANLSAKYLDGFSYSHFFDGATWLQTGRIPAFTGDVSSTGASATLTLASVGTAGTYKSVTTDAKGRVTAGTNPTTLSGFGITDAVSKAGSTMSTAANIVFDGGTVTGIPTPSGSTDVVNKAYVDAAVSSLNVHSAVDAATTANLTATYSNGTAGVGATLTNSGTQAAFQVDGYSATSGGRILVKNQTTQTQNGIYVVTTVGSGSTNWVLTRATDSDNSIAGELAPGDFVFVTEGTTQASTGWTETFIGTGTNDAIVIGTDNVVYTQFSGAGTYLAGTGLSLTGTTFNVNLGAGIAELPSTEVGVDVHATGGLMTTVDNSTSSTATAAQLALTSVGTAGTYFSVTTDSKGRVTAGTNPTTLSGFGITDGAIDTAVVHIAGTETITGSKTFSSPVISTVTTGTEPFTVASTTQVTNLNSSTLGGFAASQFVRTAATQTVTGLKTFSALATFSSASGLVVQVGGTGSATSLVPGGIELGDLGAANTPYIDFHTSGNNIDYDSRIIASGGSATIGQGSLTLSGGTIALSGSTDVTLNGYSLANLMLFDMTLELQAGANGTFTLNESASVKFQILSAKYKTDSGTITANVRIGTTSVTGLSALALTSTQGSATATAANTVNVGNRVNIVTTSNATAVNAVVTLACKRIV